MLEKSAVIPNWRWLRKGMAGEGRRIVGKVRGHTKLTRTTKRYGRRRKKNCWKSPRSYQIGANSEKVWHREVRKQVENVCGHTKLALTAKRYGRRRKKNCWKSPRSYQTDANCGKVCHREVRKQVEKLRSHTILPIMMKRYDTQKNSGHTKTLLFAKRYDLASSELLLKGLWSYRFVYIFDKV